MIKANRKGKKREENGDIDTSKSIDFTPQDHIYEVDGERKVSVTGALPDIPDYLENKQFFIDKTNLGTRVHRITEIFEQRNFKTLSKKLIKAVERSLRDECFLEYKVGELDLEYAKGWLAFLKDTEWRSQEIEVKVFSEKYDYAGTVDRTGTSPLYFNRKKAILDIKTVVKVSPTVALQLAGYTSAYNEMWPDCKAHGRLAVQLTPEAGYRVHVYPQKEYAYDRTIFLAKMMSKKWDIEHGIEPSISI